MSQMQRFIRELMVNQEFRRQALANPSAAMSAYKLTAAEQHSLGNLCHKLSGSGSASIAAQVRPLDFWL